MNVIILGTGTIGGKAQGLRFLQQHALQHGYKVPRYIAVAGDFWGVAPRPASELWTDVSFFPPPPIIADISADKITEIINAISQAKLEPRRLAIRSSSPFEDTISSPGAGIFQTKFVAEDINTEAGRLNFKQTLLTVLNSIYGRKANAYYRLMGYQNIPPIPLVIQELVGQEWAFAPGYFFPLVSGIINTANPDTIEIATVHGFAHVAVNGYTTTTHSFDKNTLQLVQVANETTPWSTALGPQGSLNFPRLQIDLPPPASNIQARLAAIAKNLEEAAQNPLDLEWASPDGQEISLLQCRPIAPKKEKSSLEIPDVPWQQEFLRTRQVLGQGSHTFKQIIEFSGHWESVDINLLQELQQEYPQALYIFKTEENNDLMILHFLPHTQCLVIADSNFRLHNSRIEDFSFRHHDSTPNSIDHLSLNIAAAQKIVLFCESLSSLYEEMPSTERESLFEDKAVIYDCTGNPLHLVADDQQEQALIYWEKPLSF